METEELVAVSWNISAVNNNPFEYWTTCSDDLYDRIMVDIEAYINDEKNNIAIGDVFTDEIFNHLIHEMENHSFSDLDTLSYFWEQKYRKRMIINGFLKDAEIGTKRLISMPDRITNTINLRNGEIYLRPTVINAYEGSLPSIDAWWESWKKFMFHTHVEVFSGTLDASSTQQVVCDLIQPMLRGKYPAITEEEQCVSVPLQILCLAIFDCILVYIMNAVAPAHWQLVRRQLCSALISGKVPKVCDILWTSYSHADAIFLQEAAAAFVPHAVQAHPLGQHYHVLAPAALDGLRDQNSLILLSRRRFPSASVGLADVTDQVLDALPGTWVAPGDLFVVAIDPPPPAAGQNDGGGGSGTGSGSEQLRSEGGGDGGGGWLLASFHGDSNGLSTQPLLLALLDVAAASFPRHRLLIGLDANTQPPGRGAAPPQTAAGFAALLFARGLVSAWGWPPPGDAEGWTAGSAARTWLQPQVHKAVPHAARRVQAHLALKDWLAAGPAAAVAGVTRAQRDNTGHGTFADGAILPSLNFPSDHALICAVFSFHRPASPTIMAASGAADRATVAVGGNTADSAVLHCTRGDCNLPAAAPALPPPAPARERTLYDYWGIAEKPRALQSLHASRSVGGGSSYGKMFGCKGSTPRADGTAVGESRARVRWHYQQLAWNRHYGALDRHRQAAAATGDRAVWILFSRRPCTMVCCRPMFQAVVLAGVLALLVKGVLYLAAASALLSLRAPLFRLTPLVLRNGTRGSAAMAASGFADWGVLFGGCRALETPVAGWRESGGGVGPALLKFMQPVRVDGYWFKASGGSDSIDGERRGGGGEDGGGDVVAARLEWSQDGKAWAEVTIPPWVRVSRMEAPPAVRGGTRYVDLRAPVEGVLGTCLGVFLFAFCAAAACLLGWLGRGRSSALALSGAYASLSVMQFVWAVRLLSVAAISSGNRGSGGETPLWYSPTAVPLAWFFCGCNATAALLLWREEYMLDGMLLQMLAVGAASLYNQADSQGSWRLDLAMISTTVYALLPPAMIFSFVTARAVVRRWVTKVLLSADRAAWDTAWRRLLHDPRTTTGLARLHASVDKTAALAAARGWNPAHLRQMLPSNAEASSQPSRNLAARTDSEAVKGSWMLPDLLDALQRRTAWRGWWWRRVATEADCQAGLGWSGGGERVTSLDQLMEQAACVDFFLREKVLVLARAHGGWLPAGEDGDDGERQFEPCATADAVAGRGSVTWHWAAVKSAERALEKLLRSYDSDPSRLLDCCRQRVVLKTPAELADCLDSVRRDREPEVVRVKDMLRPSFDAFDSAGFRCVVLNLRVKTTETERLGLSGHICELQLLLKDFAALQTNAAHRRYIIWRNCRNAPSLYADAVATTGHFVQGAFAVLRRLTAGTPSSAAAAGSTLLECLVAQPVVAISEAGVCRLEGDASGSDGSDGGGGRVGGHNDLVRSPVCSISPQQASAWLNLDLLDGGSECIGGLQPPICCHEGIPVEQEPVVEQLDMVASDEAGRIIRDGGFDYAAELNGYGNNSFQVGGHCGRKPARGVASEIAVVDSKNCHEGGSGENEAASGGDMAAETAVQVDLLVTRQYQLSVMRGARFAVDGRWDGRIVEVAVRGAGDGSLWDTGNPLTALLSRSWFVCLLAVLLAVHSFQMALFADDRGTAVESRQFRLTVLETRSGGELANVSALGLLRGGCAEDFRSRRTELTVSRDGRLLELALDLPLQVDGYWLQTAAAAGSQGGDPVRFVLEYQVEQSASGGEGGWAVAGASSWTWAWCGVVLWGEERFETSELRNATWVLPMGVARGWLDARLIISAFMVAGFASMLLAAATRRYLWGRWVMVSVSAVKASLHAVELSLLMAAGQWRTGIVAGVFILVDVLVPSLVAWDERFAPVWVLCKGLAYTAAIAGHYLLLLGRPEMLGSGGDGGCAMRNLGMFYGLVLLALATWVLVTRRAGRYVAQRIIRGDRNEYCRRWHALAVSQPTELEALDRLTMDWMQCEPIRRPRQPMTRTVGNDGLQLVAGRGGGGLLLHQLDGLMVRSAGLDIFLRAKVKDWALASGGFAAIARGGFECWQRLLDERREAEVLWARLKSPGRVLEKTYRVYRLDPSLVLDCSRQSIYFENVRGILRCLEAIRADGQARVVRVCNRLRHGYDAEATAGYRDVLLNLRLDHEGTRGLGIEAVIGELQLSLIDFAQYKTEAGHARYVMWRNQRSR